MVLRSAHILFLSAACAILLAIFFWVGRVLTSHFCLDGYYATRSLRIHEGYTAALGTAFEKVGIETQSLPAGISPEWKSPFRSARMQKYPCGKIFWSSLAVSLH
jgi:hypothetical protein